MSHRDITKTLTACLREGVPMIARPLLKQSHALEIIAVR